MKIKQRGSMGKVKVKTEDRTAPDASRRLAIAINLVVMPDLRWQEPQPIPDYGKQTHKDSEPKTNPRSYRLSVSADEELTAILATLGINNNTTGVEACIHAVAMRLGISD